MTTWTQIAWAIERGGQALDTSCNEDMQGIRLSAAYQIVRVVSENRAVTDWLEAYYSQTNFMLADQVTVVSAYGLGTGVWA